MESQIENQNMTEEEDIDIVEIEYKVLERSIKLQELKEIAKKLKIKITKMKKEEIRNAILKETYQPLGYFYHLYNRILKFEKEREHNDKTGKDYWLHKFTKYGMDNYCLLITKMHPYEINPTDHYEYKIKIIDIEEIKEIKDDFYPLGSLDIKNLEDIEIIKEECKKKNLMINEFSREYATTFERIYKMDHIEEILGYGMLCMQSKPCCHSLKYIADNGKTYLVKYAGYKFIRDLYLLFSEGDVDDIPKHFREEV